MMTIDRKMKRKESAMVDISATFNEIKILWQRFQPTENKFLAWCHHVQRKGDFILMILLLQPPDNVRKVRHALELPCSRANLKPVAISMAVNRDW